MSTLRVFKHSGSTATEEAAAVIDGTNLDYGSWAKDQAGVISGITSRATLGDAFLVHLACALIAQSGNPHLVRGAVLDGLVARYGDGLDG